jgi:putative nucleotidyltransferase-like protein
VRESLVLFDARDALAVALRLAFGHPRPEDGRADWSLVFDAASRELLAPLAWSRSGLFIRRHADAGIATMWRRVTIAAHIRGGHQLELVRDATMALNAVGVDAVVLKGLPLGHHLYGDPFVRCMSDIDLHVPAAQRPRAAATLRGLGWRSVDGAAPWHETWSTISGGSDYHLELHSWLVSDHLVHLRAPSPLSAREEIAGVELPVHAGDFVAPYLAVHLATHQLPPLLWLVDFATLWSAMSEAARGRARGAAQDAGLGRYVGWAAERGALVERVASGDWEALGVLGVDARGRRDTHSIWRHVALAASTRDRARLLGAFAVPRRVRGNVRALVRYTLARLRRRLGSLIGASRAYAAPSGAKPQAGAGAPDGRPWTLDRDEMVSLTRDVVGAGAALHVRAPGGSMLPTIPRGALVRIGPVPSSGVRAGDVVLALTGDGEPVLHRAIAVRHDCILMRGDASINVDPPVPLERVIGVATHVRTNGEDRALGRRPARSLTVSALKVRRRLARMVRRAR